VKKYNVKKKREKR